MVTYVVEVVIVATILGSMIAGLKAVWAQLRGKPTVDSSTAAGRDIQDSVIAPNNSGTINYNSAPPVSKVEWWRRDGAPHLQLHAATGHGDPCHYDMEATLMPWPQDVKYRWRGMGISMDFAEPSTKLAFDKWRLRSVDVPLQGPQSDPDLLPGEVAIEFDFWFSSENCHLMQMWPIGQAPPTSGPSYRVRRW